MTGPHTEFLQVYQYYSHDEEHREEKTVNKKKKNITYPTEEQILTWDRMLNDDAAGHWTLVHSARAIPHDVPLYLEGLVRLALIGIQNTRG